MATKTKTAKGNGAEHGVLDQERLSTWVEEHHRKFGSYAKLEAAIEAANPGEDEPVTDQTLIDWRQKKNKTMKPDKIRQLANFMRISYDEAYNWLHGREIIAKPDLIQQIAQCRTKAELLNLGNDVVFPALQLFMRRILELDVDQKEISISELIRKKIEEKGLNLQQGIMEFMLCYPSPNGADRKTSAARIEALIKGTAEPTFEEEVELAFALGTFTGQSISVDDLREPGKRALLIRNP